MSISIDLAWPDIDGNLCHRAVAGDGAGPRLEVDPAQLGWRGLAGPVRPVPDGPPLPSPWGRDRTVRLCRLVTADGEPSPACTRSVLARAIEHATGQGATPVMAAELELLLRRSPGGEPVYSFIENYGIVAGEPYEPIMRRIRALRFGHVRVTASNPEYGPGQFEINLSHGPAMAAADAICLLRAHAAELAAEAGLVADVTAKPGSELSGNGLHVHQSLWDDDRNRFWADGLSAAGRGYLGGLLRFMPELAALGSPSEDAYLRREVGSFCPISVSWGGDNRTVAVRALSESEDATRLEQRDAAADANPHLLMAGQLRAGLVGMEHALDPGPATTGNAYERDDLPRLPKGLGEAVALLEESELASCLLGRRGHAAFCEAVGGRVRSAAR
jgi:glutamine synthetase